MKALTDKQRIVLRFVATTINATGQPPTVREIGKHLCVLSSCTVQRHLDALEAKGFITRDRYKYRSLALTEQGLREVGEPLAGRESVSLMDLRDGMAYAMSRAADGVRLIVTRNGKPLCAMVPLADLHALEGQVA